MKIEASADGGAGGPAASENGGSQSSSGGSLQAPAGGAPANLSGAPATGGNAQPTSGGNASSSAGGSSTGGSASAAGGIAQAPSGGGPSIGGSPSAGGVVSAGGSSSGGGPQGAAGSLIWPPLVGGGGGRGSGGANAQGGSTGGSPPAVTTVPIGGSHTGDATFFDPNGNGNCSFGTSVLGKDIAALNNPDYQMAAWCGACADVTGPLGKIRVMIVDRCPECQSGDLDLNPEAFDKIANHADGRVTITWNFVACDVSGPVRYHYKDGSSPGWTAVQVLNHRVPIAKLEFSSDGGATFIEVERLEYNYFVYASGFGPGNVQVRITGADGQVLVDTLPPPTSDTTYDGKAQFS